MNRKTGVVATWLFLAAVPLMLGQDLSKQPSPELPSEVLGPQLIAWSQVQKPQPVPQPSPSSDEAAQRTSQEQGNTPPPQAQPQSPASQTLIGTIVKDDGGNYMLQASSGAVYQLDNQERARKYDGKQVKIAGMLDAKGNSFHIISIELIS